MTIQYTVYNTSTGEIIRTGDAMTTEQAQLQGNTPGTSVILVGSDPVVKRVDISVGSPVIINRPVNSIAINKTSITANGVDSATISGIVSVSNVHLTLPTNIGVAQVSDFPVTDGTLVVTSSVAGAYVFTISNFPNTDYVVTINAA